MAEGVSEPQGVVHATDQHAAEAPVRLIGFSRRRGAVRPEPSPHSRKFVAAIAALTGIGAGAIVIALAILLSGTSGGPAAAWSAWSPPDNGLAGERDIADQVAPFYRASPSTQLTVVTVENSSSSSSSGLQIAVRDPSTGALAAVSGTSAVYNLCGLGSNCAIATGSPSQARSLLLRREALELALYTLKYIPSIDNVVAILPPGFSVVTSQLTAKPPAPGKTTTTTPVNTAVVFQRQSLQRFLQHPLNQTLPEQLPPTVAQMSSAPEAELVSVITGQALFQHQIIQAQDGSSVLVLDPLPPQ